MNNVTFNPIEQEIVMHCADNIIDVANKLLSQVTEDCTHVQAIDTRNHLPVLIPVKDFIREAKKNKSKGAYVVENPDLLLTHANIADISVYLVALTNLPDYDSCPHISGIFAKLFNRLNILQAYNEEI